MAKVKDLLKADRLPASDTARLDLEILLATVLGKDRTYLYTWPDRELSDEESDRFDSLVERREQGEPVAHLVGSREFWSLSLDVNPSTLIPRPDTEILVETVLAEFAEKENLSVLDLGTGTGAIALALASEKKSWTLFASDRSLDACRLAQQNVRQLKLPNVCVFCARWLSAIANTELDIIVSNPPYIRASDPHLSEGDVRFEPLSALVSGQDGLDDIREIISSSQSVLSDTGALFLEHGYDQGADVRQLFELSGFKNVQTIKDYGDNDRVTFGFN